MSTFPKSEKSATEQLQKTFGDLIIKQTKTMSAEGIRSARADVKKIVTKARIARLTRREKAK
jgi:hypothetical protein